MLLNFESLCTLIIDPSLINGISYARLTNINALVKNSGQVKLASASDLQMYALPTELDDTTFIERAYDVLEGREAKEYNEVVLLVDNKNRVSKSVLELLDLSGEKIEFKATSRFEGDLSSFGPKCKFDDLVFLRFNLDDNILFIYDLNINSEEFGKLPANSKETIQDQKNQGRRPHVSLQSLFIEATKDREERAPDIIFDIRRCTIIDNRKVKK